MFDVPLHNLINHFPIALAVFAFLYDAWAVYAKRPELHEIGYGLSFWAGLLAIAAVITGLQIASLGQIGKSAVTGHALFGITTAIVLTAIALLRYSGKARQGDEPERYTMLWLVVQLFGALLVMATTLTGHRLM
jgi:uncharacterized membrane protein